MSMHYASITNRLQGLGSDKWHVHLKAKELRRLGKPVIMLTIGEPDVPVSEELMGALERSMRAGRTGYSNGRGEPSVLIGAGREIFKTHRPIGNRGQFRLLSGNADCALRSDDCIGGKW
jgi:arginine:pyruvate transaminase